MEKCEVAKSSALRNAHLIYSVFNTLKILTFQSNDNTVFISNCKMYSVPIIITTFCLLLTSLFVERKSLWLYNKSYKS